MLRERLKNLKIKYTTMCDKEINVENQKITTCLLSEIRNINCILYPMESQPEQIITAKEHDNEIKFCHHRCETEADVEMERILKYGRKEEMLQLSKVLAEHNKDLLQLYPKMFMVLLEDLKEITT